MAGQKNRKAVMFEHSLKISVVVLAFARYEMLKKLISSLLDQTVKPNEIIVVFQGKNIIIRNWLKCQKHLTVFEQENKGSAGGFSKGLLESIRMGHNWTWIVDDDAIPQNDALEKIIGALHNKKGNISFLSSRIIKPSGETYQSPIPAEPNNWYGTVLEDGCVEVTSATWLGLLINSEAVFNVGLPIEEFFLWDEDVEFTGRLSRLWKAYCVLTSVIVHYQQDEFSPFEPKGFLRFSHLVRNRLARAKIEPGPVIVKLFRVLRISLNYFQMVLRKEAPIKTIKWIIWGVFLFWPKIKPLGITVQNSDDKP